PGRSSSLQIRTSIRVAQALEYCGKQMPPSMIRPNPVSTHHHERSVRRELSAKFADCIVDRRVGAADRIEAAVLDALIVREAGRPQVMPGGMRFAKSGDDEIPVRAPQQPF